MHSQGAVKVHPTTEPVEVQPFSCSLVWKLNLSGVPRKPHSCKGVREQPPPQGSHVTPLLQLGQAPRSKVFWWAWEEAGKWYSYREKKPGFYFSASCFFLNVILFCVDCRLQEILTSGLLLG